MKQLILSYEILRRVLSVSIVGVALSFPMMAQVDCGTPVGTLYPNHDMDGESPLGSTDELVINMYIHVLREDNGSGGLSSSDVQDAIDDLNDAFDEYYIFFNYCIVELDCSDCFDEWSNLSDLFPTESFDDGLNAYLVPAVDAGYSSRAEDVPSKNLFLGYDQSIGKVFAHEVGHCLGLIHLHEDSECPAGVPEEYAFYYDMSELKPGSNCETAGDLICDTPPSLYGCVPQTSCTFQNPGSLQDPLSNVYIDPNNVTLENYMSYDRYSCWQEFTPLQVERMRDMIEYAEEISGAKSDFSHETRITTDTEWDENRDFNHDVVVESGVELTVSATVGFAAGSGLILEEGSRLLVNGGTLTLTSVSSSCPDNGDHWKGIEVSRDDDNTAFVRVYNNSIIEHADRAIFFNGPGRMTILGQSSTFRNNRMTLEAHNSTNGYARFEDCNFLVNTNYLLTSYFPQISAVHSNPVRIQGCNFDFQIDKEYAYTRQAISAYDSDILVTSSQSQSSEFINWTEGIRAYNNLGSKAVIVYEAEFEGNYRGIEAYNFWRITSNECLYDMSNDEISSEAWGIFAEQSRETRFHANDFLSTESSITSTGILIHNPGNDNNTISENGFTSLDIGVAAVGAGNAFRGLTFLCNDHSGNREYDFSVRAGISPVQGQIDDPAGNSFSNDGTNADSDFRLEDIEYDVVYYFDGEATGHEPVYAPDLEKFASNESHNCATGIIYTDPFETGSFAVYEDINDIADSALTVDNAILADSIDHGNTAVLVAYIASNAQSNPSEVIDSLQIIAPWLSIEAALEVVDNAGYFMTRGLVKVFTTSPYVVNEPEIYDFVYGVSSPFSTQDQDDISEARAKGDARTTRERLVSHFELLRNINLQDAIGYLVNQDTMIYSALRDVLAWKGADFYTEIAIADTYMDERDYEGALEYLDGVSGRITLSAEEVDALDDYIVLTELLVAVYEDDRMEDSLTGTEIDSLESWADNSAGVARTKACALLKYFEDYTCESVAYGRVRFNHETPQADIRGSDNTRIAIMPNPASDHITIEQRGEVVAIEVQLLTIQGRLIEGAFFQTDQPRLTINIPKLNAGVYLVRVYSSASKEIVVERFMKF